MSGDIRSLDHRRIEDDNLVERYVTGRLSDDERTDFEEHLVGCPDCVERAHWTEELRQGLRSVAVEDAVRPAGSGSAWVGRAPRARVALGAGAGLAAAIFVALILRSGPPDQGPGAWQARYEAERQRTAQAETARRELQQTVSRQTAEGLRLREELARSQPPVNVPTFLLSSVRAGEGSAAPNRVSSKGASWVVLSIELDPDAGFQEYRGRILARGAPVWEGGGLKAGPSAILSLLLSSKLLQPGDHVLVLEGLPPGGRAVPAGRYPFRVEPHS